MFPTSPFRRRPNNRNAAANAGFETEADFLRFRRLHQTETIQRKQRLVGGHNVFSTCQRALDKTSRRLDPANQFDHEVATVVQNLVGLRGQQRMIDAMALFIEVANQNFRDPQLDAGALADKRVILPHEFDQAAANRSAAQQSDF